MNKKVTSKEQLLIVCRDIVQKDGINAVNMRSVASECNVSLGVLYHYFASKEELITETVSSVWSDIFGMEHCSKSSSSFPDYISGIYTELRKGADQYPNFLTAHSLSFHGNERLKAKSTMNQYMRRIAEGMKKALLQDPKVRKDAFSRSFTVSSFIDFIMENMINELLENKRNCRTLCEIIRRTIY